MHNLPNTPTAGSDATRQVVFIAAIPAHAIDHSHAVAALCNDGTVWISYFDQRSAGENALPVWTNWEQLPAIPQGGVR